MGNHDRDELHWIIPMVVPSGIGHLTQAFNKFGTKSKMPPSPSLAIQWGIIILNNNKRKKKNITLPSSEIFHDLKSLWKKTLLILYVILWWILWLSRKSTSKDVNLQALIVNWYWSGLSLWWWCIFSVVFSSQAYMSTLVNHVIAIALA